MNLPMPPLFFLVFLCLLRASVAASHSKVHLQVHSSGTTLRHETLHVCSDAPQFISIQRVNTKIAVAAPALPGLSVWFYPRSGVGARLRVGTDAAVNTTHWSTTVGTKRVPVELELPAGYACRQCAPGFYHAPPATEPPFLCQPCPAVLTRREYCEQEDPDDHTPMCRDPPHQPSGLFFYQCGGNASASYAPCPSEHNATYFLPNATEPLPESEGACARHRVCAPGEYREDRLPGRPCLACAYSGEFGMQGVPVNNATQGVRGVHQAASCQCAPGRYYEPVNRVCLLCEPGQYQDRAGLATACLPCSDCHVSSAFGAEQCGACAAAEYWSERQRACRACPWTLAALQATGDFGADAGRADVWIDAARCANATLSARCQTPPSIVRGRAACLPGESPGDVQVDFADTRCGACASGKFSPDGTRCRPWQVCAGSRFEARPGNATADRACAEETELLRAPRQYPVLAQAHFELTVSAGRQFRVRGADVDAPTLYIARGNETTLSWPYGHPVMILTNKTSRASNDSSTYPMDLQGRTTTVTVPASGPVELYYACQTHPAMEVGTIRVLEQSSVTPVRADEHRAFNLSSVARGLCDAPGWDSGTYEDTLNASWWRGEVSLPFRGVASCRYQCRPGARQGRNGAFCHACEPGKFSAAVNATRCEDCVPGTFQDKAGQAKCETCATGYFSHAPGATNCTPAFALQDTPKCPAATHFVLNVSMYPNWPQSRSNCLPCPGAAQPNATRSAYGMQHCFPAQTAQDTPLPCRAGEFEDGHGGCRDCATVLTPYARVDRRAGSVSNKEACHETAACAPGYQHLNELTRLYQHKDVQDQARIPERCVKSPPQECMDREALQCKPNEPEPRGDVAFEPQDASDKFVLAIRCIRHDEAQPFNASALGSCVDFFDVSTAGPRRRSLLQVDGITVCERDQFWDATAQACVSCPANTGVDNFESAQPAQSPGDCTCKPGYYRARNISGTGASYDCRACDQEHYCPGGDAPACHNDTAASANDTSCRCPKHTSALDQTATQVADCVPDDRYDVDRQSWVAQKCPARGEDALVTYYRQGSIVDGRTIVLTNCFYQCDAARHAVKNASGFCVCDEARHRAWSAERNECTCQRGFAESGDSARACALCPANRFCPGSGQGSRECPPTMISRPGSAKKEDCVCARGQFRDSDVTRCLPCRALFYCPDGIDSVGCAQTAPEEHFICNDVGLEYGEVCTPGRRINAQDQCVSENVENKIDLDEFRLHVNHRYWVDSTQKYKNLVLRPEDIQNLTDGLPHNSIQDLQDFRNFAHLGVMAAELQMFCPHSGVVVLQDGGRRGALEGSDGFDQVFRCLSSAQLGHVLVDTARAVPQRVDMQRIERVDVPALLQRSAVFNHFLDPAFHLSWGTYWGCPGADGATEASACLRGCATGRVRLDLRRHFRIPDASAELAPVPLDTATQYRYGGGAVMLSDGAVYRVPEQDGVTQPPVVSGTGLGGGDVQFVLHSRTWHHQSFEPTVLRGECKNSKLHLRVTAVLDDAEPREITKQGVCPALDGRNLFATTHLNRLYLLYQATSNIQVFSYDMSDEFVYRKRDFDYVGNGAPVGHAQAVQWHTGCTLMHRDFSGFCPLHAVVLFRNDAGNASSVGLTMYDSGDAKMDSRSGELWSLFSGADVRNHTRCARCLPDDGRSYAMLHMALLTPSTANNTALRARSSLSSTDSELLTSRQVDPLDCLELLVFLQPAGEAASGVAHVVRAQWCLAAPGDTQLQAVPPVVVPGAIAHIAHFLAPVGVHPRYANLLAVAGRVAVFSQEPDASDLHVHLFELACFSCGDPAAASFDADAGECACRAGHAPVAVGCTGASDCNTHGLRAWQNPATHIELRVDGTATPVAFVQLCQPCSGQFYCTDGTVGGVQRCPAGRHALAPRASSLRDCACSNHTKSAGADGETTTCVACGDGEICNADVAMSELRTLPCRPHSHARGGGDECRCDDGWYPSARAAFVLRREEETLFHREYAHGFPLNQSTQSPTTHWRSVKNLCLRCPADSFCANNSRTPCPAHAAAPPGSTATEHCVCPAGSLPDLARNECVSCGGPRVDAVCVHNENRSCAGPAVAEPLCPCAALGAFRVVVNASATECRPCPHDHWCEPLSADPREQNTPRRCPAGSTAGEGGWSILNCSCAPGEFRVGAEPCRSCDAGFVCDGRARTPCAAGRTSPPGSASEAQCAEPDAGDCQAEPTPPPGVCAAGYAPRATVLGSQEYQDSLHFRDHPLAPEFSVASRQYEALPPDACVLCPPSFACHNNTLHLCRRASHFMTAAMGADRCEDYEQPCPSETAGFHRCDDYGQPCSNVTAVSHRAHVPRVGVAACFAAGSLWALRDRSPLFHFLETAHPVAMLVFPVATLEENAVWARLVNTKNRARFHVSTHTVDGGGAMFYASADAAVGAATINMTWAWGQFHTRVPSRERRARLLRELRELDHGTGVASEVLLPALWVLALREVTAAGEFEPVAVLDAVVRTPLARSVAFAAADAVAREWHRCDARRAEWAPVRVLFAVSHGEIEGFARYFLARQKHAVLYAARPPCPATARCDRGGSDVAVASFDAPAPSVSVAASHLERADDEQALREAAGLAGRVVPGRGPCPASTVRATSVPGSGIERCAVCAGEVYAREFFAGGSCAPCHAVADADCAGSARALPCSFTRDAACVVGGAQP